MLYIVATNGAQWRDFDTNVLLFLDARLVLLFQDAQRFRDMPSTNSKTVALGSLIRLQVPKSLKLLRTVLAPGLVLS